MALNASERVDQIKRFFDYLRTQIVVERAILYGSSARGQTRTESDIDLAVLSPDLPVWTGSRGCVCCCGLRGKLTQIGSNRSGTRLMNLTPAGPALLLMR